MMILMIAHKLVKISLQFVQEISTDFQDGPFRCQSCEVLNRPIEALGFGLNFSPSRVFFCGGGTCCSILQITENLTTALSTQLGFW